MQLFIDEDENSVSLKSSLFSGVDSTLTEFNLFINVAVLSSAAKIPFPFDKILKLFT